MRDVPSYDVIVAGGGAAGVAAAIGAARAGARTLLAERYGFLGGAAANANVLAYCGLFQQGPVARPAVGGVAVEVLRGLAGLGVDAAPRRSRSGNWIVTFEPEALKRALDALVGGVPGLTPALHARVTAVEAGDGVLAGMTLTDHAGSHPLRAAAFVDASGEAALGALCGAAMMVDTLRDGPGNAASLPIRLGGLPRAVLPEKPALARIAARANAMLAGGRKDAVRVRADGGVFMEMAAPDEAWWTCIDLPTDGLSSASLTAAEMEGRRIAWTCLAALRGEPGCENARIIATGPQFGIRETRRFATRRPVTEADAMAGRRDPAGIARAAWPMEVHAEPGRPSFTPLGGEGFFDVPLDAIRPDGMDNLWAGGRVIGADAPAYGSVRVMGTGFATGQAAGVAAALQAGSGAAPGAGAVRRVLLEQGAIL
ncbi:FAD-dependent oxidoreductase [Roseomonas sp. SSH11]|uniref:FAD-dependent oxidoreductase n=1 Tax=Pararoseomonas baculiformis TaxID=2820812 RepID=A0ABS4AHS7_9PROT|nr:FAD-dependent oxidoreductase [Pararoseomonas baculiformis]MBP0446555.1 FAD-dependent oxidoreductase [Pararoseomonas baculiformis]